MPLLATIHYFSTQIAISGTLWTGIKGPQHPPQRRAVLATPASPGGRWRFRPTLALFLCDRWLHGGLGGHSPVLSLQNRRPPVPFPDLATPLPARQVLPVHLPQGDSTYPCPHLPPPSPRPGRTTPLSPQTQSTNPAHKPSPPPIPPPKPLPPPPTASAQRVSR